jgi:ABC-2 type transport system permease protein
MSAVAATEQRKLIAQLPLRLLALACVLGPFAFAAILSIQHGTPADALFGAWVHSSGYALSLVVLSFAANWGFPIIAGVLAGDLFSSEDRHGTWKTILTRSQSLQDVFSGKVVTAMAWAMVLAGLVAASSLAAGLIAVGSGRFVNLGGSSLASLHAFALVVVSWLICLLPVLAYTSLAILFSVITRNGIVGVLGPVLVAVLTQLLALIGNGVWIHLLLVGTAFDAWHGLFAAHPFFGPLVVSAVVCAAWIGASLGASWAILRRREFIAGGAARRGGWRLPARIAAGVTVGVAFMALATNWGPVGVTAPRLRASFGPAFHRLTELQQQLLGHPIPATARYRILPVCNKRQTAAVGPGDWSCTMNVYIVLAAGQQPLTNTPVAYDVSVQSNGCYKASSPPAYVGGATLRDTRGHSVVNPLAVIYGCFNVL